MNNRKLKLLETLDAFVNQRPGLDPRDYGYGIDGWRCYRRESAAITKDLHDYRTIRSQLSWHDSSITADDIIKASERAFSGRLTIQPPTEDRNRVTCGICGKQWDESLDPAPSALCHWCHGRGYSTAPAADGYRLFYCAGQYAPTEYRKAACAVLASAWWDSTREDCPIEYDADADFEHSPGGWMRKQAINTFGRGVQRSYFN